MRPCSSTRFCQLGRGSVRIRCMRGPLGGGRGSAADGPAADAAEPAARDVPAAHGRRAGRGVPAGRPAHRVEPDVADAVVVPGVLLVAVGVPGVAGELLLDLFLLLGLKVFVGVNEVPRGEDTGADEDQGELASHAGHGDASGRGAGLVDLYHYFARMAGGFAR